MPCNERIRVVGDGSARLLEGGEARRLDVGWYSRARMDSHGRARTLENGLIRVTELTIKDSDVFGILLENNEKRLLEDGRLRNVQH